MEFDNSMNGPNLRTIVHCLLEYVFHFYNTHTILFLAMTVEVCYKYNILYHSWHTRLGENAFLFFQNFLSICVAISFAWHDLNSSNILRNNNRTGFLGYHPILPLMGRVWNKYKQVCITLSCLILPQLYIILNKRLF